MTTEEVTAMLESACYEAGGKAAWASQHGINRVEVYNLTGKHRPPNRSILNALGLRKVITYEPVDPR